MRTRAVIIWIVASLCMLGGCAGAPQSAVTPAEREAGVFADAQPDSAIPVVQPTMRPEPVANFGTTPGPAVVATPP
jgi:hypothetical protein